MFLRRRRVAPMLTSARSPSQSYHVAAVCGEPSRLSVAITAGFGRRSSASTSGGSGGFGTELPLLPPVPLETEIRLGEGRRPQVRVRSLALARLEIRARRGDELLLSRPVVDALRPHAEVQPRALDVLRDRLDSRHDPEVD